MLKAISILVVSFFIASLLSCSSTHTLSEPKIQDGLLERFISGESQLECGLACSHTYGSNRRMLTKLYDSEQYQELALEVLKIGYGIDQAWYYLGRAAEGLGYTETALKYYRISLEGPWAGGRCGPNRPSLLNVCDGLNVHQASMNGISRLLRKRAN